MKNMRNVLGILALSSVILVPNFASADENITKDGYIKAVPINLELDGSVDIMPINLDLSDVKVLDGTIDQIQGDIMPINAVLDGSLEIIQDDIMWINERDDKLVFYKDGKTPKVYDSLEKLLKSEKDVKYVTDGCNSGFVMPDGGAAMTMMYCMDIYGEDGHEAWSRTDTKVVISGDDASYVDEDLFQTMYNSKSVKNKVNNKISKVSTKKLEKSLDKIDDLVNTIKLTRISKEFQDLQITILYFIKDSVQAELLNR